MTLPPEALTPAWALIQDAPTYRPVDALVLRSAFARPIELPRDAFAAVAAPLSRETLFTQRSLVLNQLLFNAYEQSNLYLPRKAFAAEDTAAFEAYYRPELVAALSWLKPTLEASAFGWLEASLSPPPKTGEAFRARCLELLEGYEATPSQLPARVRAAKDPRAAARAFLIQLAPDFLSEASQMARSMPGNFGPLHSELTKIFIDEFGYGVWDQKHSTLFERCMASVGLSSEVNAYYRWYLPSSLLMTSYFYWVTTAKHRWFDYLGALYWIEAVVPHFNRQFSALLKSLFGADTDTRYFDEHVGIDLHHRRMVLDRLITPALATYGDAIVPALHRGLEMARALGDLAEHDFLEQLAFGDSLDPRAAPAQAGTPVSLRPGQVLGPRVVDATALLHVQRGALDVQVGDGVSHPVAQGQAVTVPHGRLLGAQAGADGALFTLGPTAAS